MQPNPNGKPDWRLGIDFLDRLFFGRRAPKEPHRKAAKTYPCKQLSDHGQRVSRACVLAGQTLARWAEIHGEPFRNIGTYSGDKVVVTCVERGLGLGWSVKKAAEKAAWAYATAVWNLEIAERQDAAAQP